MPDKRAHFFQNALAVYTKCLSLKWEGKGMVSKNDKYEIPLKKIFWYRLL
uniref:Uncharacterized protein n=1 Tax=Anguilla anguilla TaxID=7936 RepID=A0A0E9XIH0_ANGAN